MLKKGGGKGKPGELHTSQSHLYAQQGHGACFPCKLWKIEVTGDSHHSFKKGKSCLTNLVTFYNGFSALVYEESN